MCGLGDLAAVRRLGRRAAGGRWPVAVSLVTGAGCAGWALYGHIGELPNLPVMVALYAVAVSGGRRRTLCTAVVTVTVSGVVSMIAGIDVVQPQGAPLLEMLWPLVPLLLGEVVRGRRELTAEYADRAARAEAERDREAWLRVARERVRIARELHDVVAHTVSAMTTQAALAPAVIRRVIEEFARLKAPEAVARVRLKPLTGREREVLALVGRGLSNDGIGVRLLMSPLTAKTHVSRTMSKPGARDRAQLVVLAYETGLVRVDEG